MVGESFDSALPGVKYALKMGLMYWLVKMIRVKLLSLMLSDTPFVPKVTFCVRLFRKNTIKKVKKFERDGM